MQFEVNRQNFRETRAVDSASAPLAAGQLRLAIERFAVTTNNITYAVAGEMLDYWGFFPVDGTAGDPAWGRLPVMGLATITESANPDIAEGGRYFGFYPMADQVVIAASGSSESFVDIGAHRANHAAVYSGFRNIESDPSFNPEFANEYLLLWGMFMTSFLVDDYLGDTNFHGATQTLVTSASSKTSISLASCLSRRPDHAAVGVTSDRNRAFVESLGLYDQVITYDEIDQLDSSVAAGMVDMAGNAAVRSNVHTHFGDTLTFSLTVGATHWEAGGDSPDLPGPTPEFFFAPAQSAKRAKDWGPAELAANIAVAFQRLLDGTGDWLNVSHLHGADGMKTVYDQLIEGSADPSTGFVVSMGEPG